LHQIMVVSQGTVKHLVVEATCSSGGGYSPQAASVYAQGYVKADGTQQVPTYLQLIASHPSLRAFQVLVVNKAFATASVTVTGATGGTW
jgi:hypothetical protein